MAFKMKGFPLTRTKSQRLEDRAARQDAKIKDIISENVNPNTGEELSDRQRKKIDKLAKREEKLTRKAKVAKYIEEGTGGYGKYGKRHDRLRAKVERKEYEAADPSVSEKKSEKLYSQADKARARARKIQERKRNK